jgi:hypothetical protein
MYYGQDSVYFNHRTGEWSFSDSVDVSFAYSPVNVRDTLLAVPVAATGTFSDKDRPVSLVADPLSTARQGMDYDLPPTVFHAGKIADTFFIRLKRTADLTSAKKTLILRLQPNESFKTDLRYRIALTTDRDTLDLVRFTIDISDMLSAGPYWSVYTPYFGTFSLKKVRFMNQLVGMPLNFWLNGEPTTNVLASAIYYAATTSRYLNEQAAQGNIIYDEDGTPMQMGPGYR